MRSNCHALDLALETVRRHSNLAPKCREPKMLKIEYSAQNTALYHPELSGTVLQSSKWPSGVALAAELSRLAYIRAEDPGTLQFARLENALEKGGFASPTLLVDATKDAYGYASIDGDGFCILAFRGTQADRFEDFLTNIQIMSTHWPTAGECGRVHKGFRDSAAGLLKQTTTWLQDIASRRKRLLICGHSLGGAIATLLAITANADALITFGCPRVGDDDFADALESRATLQINRVVDCCDVVPTVPPPYMGYHHAGAALYIDHQGLILKGPSYAELRLDRRAGRKAYSAIWLEDPAQRVPFRELADHAPINYIRAFWR